MTPEERQQFEQLKAQVAQLAEAVKEKQSTQFSFPLDIPSAQALVESFRTIRFGRLNIENTSIFSGSGAPTILAPKGSLYLRTDGSSTSTRLYVNTDAGTSWTNITTAT